MNEENTTISSDNKQLDLASNVNTIQQMSIRELMDDRYFFIPSYQRGYRWGRTQIYDLCNDLLDYALKKEKDYTEHKDNKSFYCLQPVIVIPKEFKIKDKTHNGYEVVDGQQRLTSLFILYRYLVNNVKNLSEQNKTLSQKEESVKDWYGTQLYHIYYETRPEDYDTFEKIGYENLKDADIKDIDIAHISNAYQHIKTWYTDEIDGAKKVLDRFGKTDESQDYITQCLLNLLHNKKDSTKGSVQVIWYELDAQKDAVKEFIKENTGKIKLTDTELIKGLFLQKRNWSNKDIDVARIEQFRIGKDWELIENTLHHNDFWAFLCKDIHQEDNRINIVFEYIYQNHHSGERLPKDIPNALFRFYSDYFEDNFGKSGGMSKLWDEVKECFQAIQNWYNDPYIYNLIGLLTRQGKSLYDINKIFNENSIVTRDNFLGRLKEEIGKSLPKPIENKDSFTIFPKKYFKLFKGKDDNEIRILLLFVNVLQLCKQIDQARKDIELGKLKSDKWRTEQDLMSQMYRFPYDVLESFNWDLEHVDSATTNQLQQSKDKLDWIAEAEKVEGLGDTILNDSTYNRLKSDYQKNKKDDTLEEMITQIKMIAGDDVEDSSEQKDWIGNMTLLDCGTNRGYGNALYVTKQKKIQERRARGVFVPICTQRVFEKNFDGCAKDSWRWDWDNKKTHHQFLIDEYDEFIKEIEEDKKNISANSMNTEEIGE